MTPQSAQALEEKIKDLVASSLTLAHESGAGLQTRSELEAERDFFLRPFCYAAFGASKTGKTTLLQECLGESWELEEDRTDEGCVLWAHSPAPARWKKTHTGGMIERFVPLEIFRQVEVLDSAGAEKAEVQAQAEYAAAFGDVIFLLFRQDNLEDSYTWELGDKIMRLGGRNVVLVLTHVQEESEREVQVSLAFLSEMARRRWNQRVAALVYMIEGAYRENALLKIEHELTLLKGQSYHRYKKQEAVLSLVEKLLNEVLVLVSTKVRAMQHDGGFLQELESEIDALRSLEVSKVPAMTQSLGQMAYEFFPIMMKTAAASLGYYPSLLKFLSWKHLPLKLDKWVCDVLSKRFEARLGSYDLEFLENCRTHWQNLAPRALGQINCEIGPFPQEELTRFLQDHRLPVRRMVVKPLLDFKLRQYFMQEMTPREGWMRSLFIFILVFICLAALLGIGGLHSVAMSLLAVSFGIWVCGIFFLWVSRKNLAEVDEEKRLEFAHLVRDTLADTIMEGTLSKIISYRELLVDIHMKITDSRNVLAPLQENLNHLFIEAKLMKREL